MARRRLLIVTVFVLGTAVIGMSPGLGQDAPTFPSGPPPAAQAPTVASPSPAVPVPVVSPPPFLEDRDNRGPLAGQTDGSPLFAWGSVALAAVVLFGTLNALLQRRRAWPQGRPDVVQRGERPLVLPVREVRGREERPAYHAAP
jgi:hypothetical protein